jgi:hypothetical protein
VLRPAHMAKGSVSMQRSLSASRRISVARLARPGPSGGNERICPRDALITRADIEHLQRELEPIRAGIGADCMLDPDRTGAVVFEIRRPKAQNSLRSEDGAVYSLKVTKFGCGALRPKCRVLDLI